MKRSFDFLDQTQSARILGEAIKEAYGGLFAINVKAIELSVEDAKNKFRTLTQGQNSDKVLGWMAETQRNHSYSPESCFGSRRPEVRILSPRPFSPIEAVALRQQRHGCVPDRF